MSPPTTAPADPRPSVGSAASPSASPAAQQVAAPARARPRTPAAKPWRVRAQVTLRSLHIHASMATLLVILFFSGSGVLLNHPEWTAGLDTTRAAQGTLPPALLGGLRAGAPDWLPIVETLRDRHDLRGRVSDPTTDGTDATLNFKGPGVDTSVLIDVQTGEYDLRTTSAGLSAVIGDLHRGHNTGPGWRWVIDLTAAALTVISASGFGILLFLKKHRRKALTTLGVGTALLAVSVVTLAM